MFDRDQSSAERITQAMRTLPRDRFIELGDPTLEVRRSIPPTNAVSEILNHAGVKTSHKVLVIGTGAGYLAALLAKLAQLVVALEINPAIARMAQNRFNKLGLANLILRVGDGTGGAADLGPFDRIFVASPKVIDKGELIGQLAIGGRLLAIEEGESNSLFLTRYEVTELGVTLHKELALVDFSRDTGMTLLDMGMVDQVMLSEARRIARQKKLPIISVLRDKLNVEDATLYRNLAAENGMPFALIDELLPRIQPELMERFSRSFLDSNHLIPLNVQDHSLHVATDDPDCSIDDIYHMYPYEQVLKVLVTPNDFKRLWTTVELSLHGDVKQLWGGSPEWKSRKANRICSSRKSRG